MNSIKIVLRSLILAFICYFFNQSTFAQGLAVQPGTLQYTYAVVAGTSPGAISETPASAGSGNYSYQWQSSSDNQNFVSILNATSVTYTPGNISSTTYFRRQVNDGVNTKFTNVCTVSIITALNQGGIGSNQTIYNGVVPATLSFTTAPSGGTGSYTYQWQSSGDNSTWVNISGATSNTYTPPALTLNTFYRASVTSGTSTLNTTSILITVRAALSGGVISAGTSIVSASTPPTITTITGAGGGSGTYTYQWQYTTNSGSTWTSISGANGTSYSPGALTTNTSYRIAVNDGNSTAYSTLCTFTITAPLSVSNIGSSSTINYNTIPAVLTGNGASGGTGSYAYQWQSSTNGGTTWTNISGATGTGYQPGALTVTTSYKLVVVSGTSTVSSNIVTITVYPQLVAGTLPASYSLVYNTSIPTALSSSGLTGGNGVYSYQWQSSTDNATWTNISGATSSSYQPGNLTASIFYRLSVTSNSVTVNTASCAVTVGSNLNPGAIGSNASITTGTAPSTLIMTTAPTGGTGTYTYQWQSSTDNINFTNISGATNNSYSPAALTANTYYRLSVTSGTLNSLTNVVTISVHAALSAGTVSSGSSIVPGGTPAAITIITGPGGGSGTYTYQWQVSTNSTTWSNISGATGTSYSPGALSVTTYYRLSVNDGTTTAYSNNYATVTVTAALSVGAIGSNSSINYNTIPSVLTSNGGSGGAGNYTYQWQSSTDNATWTNISGATGTGYQPGALTVTTYYHLVVTSGGSTVTSNTVTITVYPQLTGGNITCVVTTINAGQAPSTINDGGGISGGNGVYTYQWQSNTGSGWVNISGATAISYSPGVLNVTTSFQRIVMSNGASALCGYPIVITVKAVAALTAGVISAGTSIISGSTPPAITILTSPGGGSGTYTYQWQSSPDGTTWTNISGATGTSYSPGALTSTANYRLSVNDGTNTAYSNVCTITVTAGLSVATIGSSSTINYNTIPSVITGNGASGGTGTYSYQWQSSTDNATWTNISGATGTGYQPGALTVTTYYRLSVTSGSATVTSNSVTITVYPQLTGGNITCAITTINAGQAPSTINDGGGVSGGNGVYTYQWQSNAGSGWVNISGATSISYSPGVLNVTTSFQRIVMSNGASALCSYAIIITVNPSANLVGPVIGSGSTITSGSTPGAITMTSSPTGGSGTYTYQWQVSANNSTWSNISGATATSYAPGVLTTTTYYRLSVNDGTNTAYSNVATITVNPASSPLVAGTIASSSTISYNSTPSPLTSTSASGGNGIYTYQWQSSIDNSNWVNISGATSTSYAPGVLTSTTYYRLAVTSNGVSAISNVVTITVSQPVNPGNCPNLNTVYSKANNYILTSTPRISGITNTNASWNSYTACQVEQNVQYIDGLGRPIQNIQVFGSPTYADIVQVNQYDANDREAVKYLPYTDGINLAGSFRKNALLDANGNYSTSDQYLFYQKTGQTYSTNSSPSATSGFEPSPLNRIIEQGAPGNPWQLSTSGIANSGHTQKMDYATNSDNSIFNNSGRWVKSYTVNIDPNTGLRTLVDNGSYPANSLTLTIKKDENWSSTQNDATYQRLNTTEEYKDLEGRVVCKRTYNWIYGTHIEFESTYYVYDDLGNLSYVIPPLANGDNGGITQTTLDNLCYQYNYDFRQRQIEKKIPGKAWEFTVYNSLDQIAYTQDGNQRGKANQQWKYFMYDGLGRNTITGLWTSSIAGDQSLTAPGRTAEQSLTTLAANHTPTWETRTNATSTGYTADNPSGQVLSINYYDDYSVPGLPSTYIPVTYSNLIRGLKTVSLSTVLDANFTSSTPNSLWATTFYDDLGRVQDVFGQHYLGGTVNNLNYDHVINSYDFKNELITTNRFHFNVTSPSTPILNIANTYVYDQVGRKTQTFEQINGGTKVILSQNVYNELSQLATKNLYSENLGQTFLAGTNYLYNEKGWLLSQTTNNAVKGNFFTFNLGYNLPTNGATTPQFNGNISEMLYNGPISGQKYFEYSYDNLNRLTSAVSTNSALDENISYDQNGNTTFLQRLGTGNTAQYANTLNYTYSNTGLSNQLITVTGWNAPNRTYSYDLNGNATTNGTNLGINYNLLNLPQAVVNGTSTIATYIYNSNGAKLRNTGTDGTWDYINGIIYHNGIISFVQTEEGRALISGTSINFQYVLKDHLGNSRLTFDKNLAITGPVQEVEYYSFGLSSKLSIPSPDNKYLYNGKEQQYDLANQYDYGARFYDPVIAKWSTIDPLSEKMRRWSSYNFTFDNPIRFTDPDGMLPGPGEEDNWLKRTVSALVRLITRQPAVPDQVNMDPQTSSIINTTAQIKDANTAARGIIKAVRIGVPKALEAGGSKVSKIATPIALTTKNPIPATIAAVANTVSTIGTVGVVANNFYDGEYKEGVTNAAFKGLSMVMDKFLDNLGESGQINKFQKFSLGEIFDKAADKVKENVEENQKK